MPVPSLSQSQTLMVTEDFHLVLLILFYFLSSFCDWRLREVKTRISVMGIVSI